MNALKADPRTVDLRSLAPHFYRLGVRILQLFEEEEMVDVLMEVSWWYIYIYILYTHIHIYIFVCQGGNETGLRRGGEKNR